MPSLKQTVFTLPLLFLSACAQTSMGPNAFNVPMRGYSSVTAGQSQQLTWKPTTDGTVTLVLRSGNAGNLNQGTLIASDIPNSGSYTWAVPADITRGSDYTVEIIADNAPDQVNFTPQFSIDSTNTVASSTGIVTVSAALAASSAAASEVSASSTSEDASATATGASMSSMSSTGTATDSGASSTRASNTASATGADHTGGAPAGVKGGAMGALAIAAGLAAFL